MPAIAPPIGDTLAARLAALGDRIRDKRKRLGVNATATAEAAGMSRVTLHRIERGEPSVTMGAYLSAIAALGLELELIDPAHGPQRRADSAPTLPPSIKLADYPQLQRLAWQLQGVTELSPQEALALYERNWRHVEQHALGEQERMLVKMLAAELGGGRLLV